MQGEGVVLALDFLDEVAAEDIGRFERVELEFAFAHLVVFDIFAIDVYPRGELLVQEDRVYDVEHILPEFKVCHNCHLTHIDFQHLAV